MGLVDNNIRGEVRLFLGKVKDHASVCKAIVSSLERSNNVPRQRKFFRDIEIIVLRATSHDNGSINDKHVHQILFLVCNSPGAGATPFLAETISRRLAKTSDPLVALKALSLIHHLLRGGNWCFEQELRGAYLSGHLQMSNLRKATISNDSKASCFLNRYAAYLEERIGWLINQDGRLEPVVTSSQFRHYDDRSIDLVFRKLPKCQVYIDKVLDCLSCDSLPPPDGENNLTHAASCNVLKESFQVYKTYSEGIESLINMFFDLTKQARALACKILEKASHQSQRLHDLYEKCNQVTGNSYYSSSNHNHHKNMKYPSVQIITMDHVMALELCSLPCSYVTNLTPPCHSFVGLDYNHKGGLLPASSTSFPRYNCLTKPSNLQQPPMMSGEVVKGAKSSSLSSGPLFSWKLETKISKIWVVFEDEYQDKMPSSAHGYIT